jgi:hypothetical protein
MASFGYEHDKNETSNITTYFLKSDITSKNTHLFQKQKPQINLSLPDMMHHLCFNINNNDIILDYKYFKMCAFQETYEMLIKYIVETIQFVLLTYPDFSFHINMKSLTLSDIDKYYTFIQSISERLKSAFPNKLNTCYVYNAPFIFSQLFNTLSCFIDKKTQQKIVLK